MVCKITRTEGGKINGVLNQTGQPSTLFKQIFNTPTLSIDEAINAYKNIYSNILRGKIQFQIVGEKGASRFQQYQELLNQAKNLEIQGKDYSNTGWYKSVDGWKFISKEIINEFKIQNYQENKILTLKEVLGNENTIFTIYPEMANLKVVFYNKNVANKEGVRALSQNSLGEFDGNTNTITVSVFNRENKRTLAEMQNTLGHEVSHYGAKLEGFSRGGNEQSILEEAISILNLDAEGRLLSEIATDILNADTTNLSKEQVKIVKDSLQTIGALISGDVGYLYRQYKHILGEIDANIVGELSQNNRVVGTYGDLISAYINRQNIDSNSIYLIGRGEVEFQIISEPTSSLNSPQEDLLLEVQQQLQKLGLVDNFYLMTNAEIEAKLTELGVDANVAKQIIINGQQVTVKALPNQLEVVNGFYSPIEKALLQLNQEKGTAAQYLAQIKKAKGVKQDELQFTGIEQYLTEQGNNKITKQDILDYMKENRVEIVEVVKGTEKIVMRDKAYADFDASIITIEERNEVIDKLGVPNETKFSQYQLEGEKENYKEVLVTLPSKNVFDKNKVEIKKNYQSATQGTFDVYYDGNLLAKGYDLFSAGTREYGQKTDEQLNLFAKNLYEKGDKYNKIENKQGNFKSSHFDEPNILVHLRMNTRTDADGNKVLFLEEVQSDFSATYRKSQEDVMNFINKNEEGVIELYKKSGKLEVEC